MKIKINGQEIRYFSVRYSPKIYNCYECKKVINVKDIMYYFRYLETEYHIHQDCLENCQYLKEAAVAKLITASPINIQTVINYDRKQIQKQLKNFLQNVKKEEQNKDKNQNKNNLKRQNSKIKDDLQAQPIKKQKKNLIIDSEDSEQDSIYKGRGKYDDKMDVEEEDEPIIKNFDKIQKEMEKLEKQKYTLEQLKDILENQNIVPLSDDNKDELIFQIAQCKVNNIIPGCYMCGGGVLQFVNKKQRYECQGFDMDGEQIECKCYFMEDEIKKREWVEL